MDLGRVNIILTDLIDWLILFHVFAKTHVM